MSSLGRRGLALNSEEPSLTLVINKHFNEMKCLIFINNNYLRDVNSCVPLLRWLESWFLQLEVFGLSPGVVFWMSHASSYYV